MSTIKHRVTVLLVAAALPAAVLFTPSDGDASPLLGSTAETFAVLAGSGVANAGATTIVGNVGSAPTNSISGFMPPAIITDGAIASTAAAQQAQIEASAAYNAVLGLTPTQSLTGQNMGGLTLVPGVYDFSSSAR